MTTLLSYNRQPVSCGQMVYMIERDHNLYPHLLSFEIVELLYEEKKIKLKLIHNQVQTNVEEITYLTIQPNLVHTNAEELLKIWIFQQDQLNKLGPKILDRLFQLLEETTGIKKDSFIIQDINKETENTEI